MKEINFINVGAKNFKNYKELITYDFINGTINLITGPNGIGKTTIFDILPFTLYGITPSGLRSEDVVNNEVDKDCETYATFKIGEDLYKVERYVKHSKYGDTVLISKNGEKPYKKGQREIVPEVESLICPQKLFMNTVLFGQKVKNFFTDLTDSEQKEIFRKVLQLDDYLLYYDETSKRLKKLNEADISLNNDMNISKNMIGEISSQIKFLISEKEKFNENKETLILELEKDINYLNNQISEKNEFLKTIPLNINEKISEFQIIIASKNNELKDIDINNKKEKDIIIEKVSLKKSEIQNSASETKNEALILKESKLKESIEDRTNCENLKLKLQNSKSNTEKIKQEILSQNSILSKIQKEIIEIEKDLSKDIPICVTCKQKIGEEQINIFKNIKLQKNQEILEINEKLNQLNVELNEENKIMEQFHEQYVNLSKNIIEHEEKINNDYKNVIDDLNNKLKAAAEKIGQFLTDSNLKIDEKYRTLKEDILKNIEKYSNELQILNEKLNLKNTIDNEINNLKSDLKVKNSNLENSKNSKYDSILLEAQTSKFHTLKLEYEKLKQKLSSINIEKEATEFWKNGFSSSGIPSILIDEAVPEMNKRIKKYLEDMGGRYIVSFDTLSETKSGEIRDKISVNVLDTITKSNKRKAFSGGQVRIVDIAVLLTLSDIQNMVQNMKTNVILLDEIFDSLDEENISYVSSILRKICKDKSINIISHTVIDQIEADQIFKLG